MVQKTPGASASRYSSLAAGKRFYSTNGEHKFKPAVVYTNTDTQKELIFKDNKGKPGVYRWINNLNGKSYIGSSVNLSRRLREYFNIYYLERNIKKNIQSNIYRALFKYGYSAFSLEILEYCDPSEAINKEQYFIDLLKPNYNILPNAGSRLGHKHSEETIAKFKGRKLSEETKAKLKIRSSDQQEHIKILNKKKAQIVEIFDTLKNVTTVYPSLREAEREMKVDHNSIKWAIKQFKDKGVSILINERYRVVIEGLTIIKTINSRYSSFPEVEVLDILNNKTTSYHSIRAAGRAIGCSATTIRNALNHLQDKGVYRLIKKQYRVTLINDES